MDRECWIPALLMPLTSKLPIWSLLYWLKQRNIYSLVMDQRVRNLSQHSNVWRDIGILRRYDELKMKHPSLVDSIKRSENIGVPNAHLFRERSSNNKYTV